MFAQENELMLKVHVHVHVHIKIALASDTLSAYRNTLVSCLFPLPLSPHLSLPQPHLHQIVLQSMSLANTAPEPCNYFLLLRALFRSIGGGSHEQLYQEFLPLLSNLLQGTVSGSRTGSVFVTLFPPSLSFSLHPSVPLPLPSSFSPSLSPSILSTLLPYLPLSLPPSPLLTFLLPSFPLSFPPPLSLLLGLNRLQSGHHKQYMKDLFVELCLTVPVRLR